MAKRIILAGILGGIVFFFWGFVYHELLPFGEAGLKELPNEQAVLNNLKTEIPEPGMYLFPGWGLGPDATSAQRRAAMDEMNRKASTGPQGILVYYPVGHPLSGTMLLTECSTDIVQSLIVAFLLAQAGKRRFSSRLGFAFVIGLAASITTNVSFWNWYRFPGAFMGSNIVFLVLAYFLVGMVAAAIVKSAVPKSAAAVAA
jgi:hypothetical protein